MTPEPDNMTAFVFYVEPNPFEEHEFTALATSASRDTLELTQFAHVSSGATGFAFYTSGSDRILSVDVSSDIDFAVGEFSFSKIVPAPGALALLGMVGFLGARRRRH